MFIIVYKDISGFNERFIYLIKDTLHPGSYKIGLGTDPNRRLISLNTASAMKTLRIVHTSKTQDMLGSEKMVHTLLDPFKIQKRKEWFYLKDNLELNYTINLIKNTVNYINTYAFQNYTDFKAFAETQPQEIEIKEENINVISLKKDKQQRKFGNFYGVSYKPENNKWAVRINKDHITYTDSEIEAAKAYNDHALFLNQTQGTNYSLNEIQGYTATPRDICEENKEKKYLNKTSKYFGVYFIKSKQIFEASIRYKTKTYKLIQNNDEFVCAKMYNEQAMYFNNNLDTKYKINDGLETTSINHLIDLELNKIKKYSRFMGVSIRKDSGHFRAYLKYQGKRVDCGTFHTEEEAAASYNKKANELNQLETTKIKYKLNILEEYLDLRSAPPVPKADVGPFLNSSYDAPAGAMRRKRDM